MARKNSSYDLQQLTRLAVITAEIVEELGQLVVAGNNAAQLEDRAQQLCQQQGVQPAFQGYQGYQYALCLSVNDEVVHALPTADKVFNEGDVVSIDFGVTSKGYYSDHCRTFGVGQLSEVHQHLLATGRQAVERAIAKVKSGVRIGDLSHQMESTAVENGFSIVTNYVGHGIGKKLHESPEIPAFGQSGTGPKLEKNMVVCVECQVCEGSSALIHDRDGWTARTQDGGYAVMFEHMVQVLDQGSKILTKLK